MSRHSERCLKYSIHDAVLSSDGMLFGFRQVESGASDQNCVVVNTSIAQRTQPRRPSRQRRRHAVEAERGAGDRNRSVDSVTSLRTVHSTF